MSHDEGKMVRVSEPEGKMVRVSEPPGDGGAPLDSKARRVCVNFEKGTSTTSAFTLTKMIGENYLFLQTSRFLLMNESTTSGCEF